ncbi:MAG TPA: hypothetical protein P5318_11050 [Candidatus Hydrogenedentes bacterium]|nr:hypothetical protein [Candidatus Hydrogenedentota bacterium]HRT20651.1 hypothetical protein [Candidatus Hydrogenedentota bacterium]HRT65686.1 hypothetical protein [Candidatus Hydrogenedentota bacterium]
MKKMTLLIPVAVALMAHAACPEEPYYRDLYPDTWVATDALGRTMPDFSTVGPVKNDQRRIVGIFYITWHSDSLAGLKSPYAADVTKVLAADPNARLDAKHPLWTEGSYHWGEPEMGYFLSKDEYVIRKDMSMLSDAGVDVLVMDVTNAVRYWDEWDVVFPVMQKMKAEGNKVPQFCFWAFNGPVIAVVQDLYERIYKPEKYRDLWFYWDGKPLLLYNDRPDVDSTGQGIKQPNPHYDPAAKTDPGHPHYGDPAYTEEFYSDYTQEVKVFFTLRTMWWGYYEWAGKRFIGTEDKWSFGYDMGDERVKALPLEALVSTHNGQKEEAAVTPAQHPSSLTGKSWTREHGEPELNEYDLPVPTHVPWLGKTVEHPEGYGIYFQERWNEAIKANPQFLYINDWNEWTAGKYQPGEGKSFPFMRRQSPFFFVDQYNAEFNRCIQPMKDGYTDNYYMQMAQNIRRYKGIRPVPELRGLNTMQMDGAFEDWKAVPVEYRDTAGDTFHRDYKGYGGLHYTNNSGRNDIVTCKMAVDRKNIYCYAETREPLTPHTDTHWMLLLIDADQNHATGWFGYDFLVNKNVPDDKTTSLMRYDAKSPDKPWAEVARLEYRYAGKAIEIAIPRHLLGLKGRAFAFDFHWCDNPADLKDPISLCVNGDSAPNRRFNYRCIWKSKG